METRDITNIKKEILLDQSGSRLVYYQDWIPKDTQSELLRNLLEKTRWQHDKITLFGITHPLPRLHSWVADPGCEYTYSKITLFRNEWFKELFDIKERLNRELKTSFNGCLLNLYRDGKDSNGWHSDDEKEMLEGASVASVSLGELRRFDIKDKKSGSIICRKWLEPGSLLIMEGNFQRMFYHQIPKSLKRKNKRVNLTFREVLKKPQ